MDRRKKVVTEVESVFFVYLGQMPHQDSIHDTRLISVCACVLPSQGGEDRRESRANRSRTGKCASTIVSCTTHGLAVQHAGALFRQFRRFELQPHANGRSQDARLSRVLASFRRVDGKPPLTPADLRSLQSLSATDIATTPEVVHSA